MAREPPRNGGDARRGYGGYFFPPVAALFSGTYAWCLRVSAFFSAKQNQ
jgi:hypothetical protein